MIKGVQAYQMGTSKEVDDMIVAFHRWEANCEVLKESAYMAARIARSVKDSKICDIVLMARAEAMAVHATKAYAEALEEYHSIAGKLLLLIINTQLSKG